MTNPVVREFQEDLARLSREHANDPEAEWRALYLLALEREQIVTVHYAGKVLHERIERLQAPHAMKHLVHHALRWAARDEDMHAVYARGVLFRRGERGLALRALASQLGGLVAGWSSAVSQHASFAEAPVSRVMSGAISLAGLVGGKVPQSARKTLSHQSFSGFATFNEEAEETSAMCWERIAELGLPEERDLCLRVAEEERKHAAVFRAFVEMFDDGDALREGATAERLEAKLRAVDPVFLPRALREETHKLGTGADVIVCHSPSATPAAHLHQCLVQSGLLDAACAGRRLKRVAIKTTFMMSYDDRDRSTTVDPELANALFQLLRERGAEEIMFLETGNLFDHYFARRSVQQVAHYMGFFVAGTTLVDAALEQVPHTFRKGLLQSTISQTWRDADFRISLAKMPTNPSFLVHLSLGNLEALGQRIDHMLFADRVADVSTGLMMTLDEFPCHLSILDAKRDIADGLTGIMGTAEPRHPERLYASEDALALDWVAARHMGLKELPRTASCAAALDWFGDVRKQTRVIGLDTRLDPFTSPHQSECGWFALDVKDGSARLSPRQARRHVHVCGPPHSLAFIPLWQRRWRMGLNVVRSRTLRSCKAF